MNMEAARIDISHKSPSSEAAADSDMKKPRYAPLVTINGVNMSLLLRRPFLNADEKASSHEARLRKPIGEGACHYGYLIYGEKKKKKRKKEKKGRR